MPITAKFHPQAWINDYAVDADPQGQTTFDVTEAVEKMGREKALALEDNSYESDELREIDSAPEWIREWAGPFWVEVEQSITKHFAD